MRTLPAARVMVTVAIALASLFAGCGDETAVVPDVRGLTEEDALEKLEQVGIDEVEVRREASTAQAGKVVSTSPEEGSEISSSESVELVVSEGPG